MLAHSQNRPHENSAQMIAVPIVRPLEVDQIGKFVACIGGQANLRTALALTVEQLEQAVRSQPGLSQIAETPRGHIVGYLYARWSSPSRMYIQNVWVDLNVRETGIALSMVQASVRGAQRVVPDVTAKAEVLTGNIHAHNLFLKAGFIVNQLPHADKRAQEYLYTPQSKV